MNKHLFLKFAHEQHINEWGGGDFRILNYRGYHFSIFRIIINIFKLSYIQQKLPLLKYLKFKTNCSKKIIYNRTIGGNVN